MASKYTHEYIQDVLSDWEFCDNSNDKSMREFCEDWDIPRSTFQGWLKRAEALPENRYYFAPKQEVEDTFIPTEGRSPAVGEVLQLLAHELSDIAANLSAIASKL